MKIKFSKNIERFNMEKYDSVIVFHNSPCGFGIKIKRINREKCHTLILSFRISKLHKFGIYNYTKMPYLEFKRN